MKSHADLIFSNPSDIAGYDADLWQAMQDESIRQEDHIELIASENYASKRVLEAQGSLLTNKYAEGYPDKRYYGGCEFVDVAEHLAIERAKELYQADYANVQPHSGSSANAAAFLAMLEPNDNILGMSLDHGGHLTHGAKVNFSGRNYNAFQYGLHPETHDIDYDQVRDLAKKHTPKLIIAGFSAFSGIVDWEKFADIANEVMDMVHLTQVNGVNFSGRNFDCSFSISFCIRKLMILITHGAKVIFADVFNTSTTIHKKKHTPKLIIAGFSAKIGKSLQISLMRSGLIS